MIYQPASAPFLCVDAADSPTRIVLARRQQSRGVLMDLFMLSSSSC
jgi:hypothetical protein